MSDRKLQSGVSSDRQGYRRRRKRLESWIRIGLRRLGVGTLERPDRTLIITGIPRGGTSLFSSLLNQVPGVVCFNEIFYDVSRLPVNLETIRMKLINGEPVPNKYDAAGHPVADTMDGARIVNRPVAAVDPEVVVATNVNSPYLFRLGELVALKCPVVAIVRDPVFTLASWGSERTRAIPEANTGPPPSAVHRRWRRFRFRGQTAVERRAEVWNHLAGLLLEHQQHIDLIHYETLVERPVDVVSGVVAPFGRHPVSENFEGVQTRNRVSRFHCLDEIREALERYAPNRRQLGYD